MGFTGPGRRSVAPVLPGPRQRVVTLEPDDARAVAERFALGDVESVAMAARGWASLNVTWRIRTTLGAWAVKDVARESPPELEAAAEIELAAEQLGVLLPRVVPSRAGTITATVGGRVFRCHEFVTGEPPTGALRATEAASAGEALGLIHHAELPWKPESMHANTFGEAHWHDLIDRAARLGAPWTKQVRAAMPAILAAEELAAEWWRRPHRWIGSHRDVRPDNALRSDAGLLLVDWDAAGPVVQGREVERTLPWWEPHADTFLRGYQNVVGDVDLDEGHGDDGGLGWWLETNVRHALALPGDDERNWAVSALVANFRVT